MGTTNKRQSNGTQTITFESPGPTNGGNRVPEHGTHVGLRRLTRPSQKLIADRLRAALDNMESVPCTFWACNGPNTVRHMITCTRCWAVRDMRVALRHAEALAKVER